MSFIKNRGIKINYDDKPDIIEVVTDDNTDQGYKQMAIKDQDEERAGEDIDRNDEGHVKSGEL